MATDGRVAEQERDPGQRVWRVVPAVARPRAPAWVVGKLVHEALAAWRFPDADGFFERWAEAHARSYGLTDARQLADAVRESGKLLLRFRGTSLARRNGRRRTALARGTVQPGHHGERPRVRTASSTRSICAATGRWTIVEFKTDHVRDAAALERLLAEEDYLAQAERYAAAVERLLGSRPQVALCLLDYAGGVHVHR